MSQNAELQTSILLLLNGGQEMKTLYVFCFNSLHPYDHIGFLLKPGYLHSTKQLLLLSATMKRVLGCEPSNN